MNVIKALWKRTSSFVRRRPLASIAILLVVGVLGNVAMLEAEKHPALACAPCHVMQPYVDGYCSGDVLARKHAEAGVNCIDCHENGIEDKIKETVWYVTDNFDDPPVKHDFGNQMCTKCHTNMDEIIAKTDKGGINPHDSHLGELHCADCHKMHMKSQAACQNCHDFEFLHNLPVEWKKIKKIEE